MAVVLRSALGVADVEVKLGPAGTLATNRPPKGDRSEEFDFFHDNYDFCILANNLNFGLSEIVQGTFLKIPIFC